MGREADILSNANLYDNIIYPFDEDRIKIFYNGTEIRTDTAPVIENDRTLVPLRAIFEAMGCVVDWSQEEQEITVVRDGISVVLYIGSEEMLVNGNVIILDTVPEIINERTMVPVRAISEAVNCTVEWKDTERNIIIADK